MTIMTIKTNVHDHNISKVESSGKEEMRAVGDIPSVSWVSASSFIQCSDMVQ